MTSLWPEKRLGELAQRIFVGIASAATHAYRDSGVLLLRNLNIKEGGIDRSNLIYIDPVYEKQHARKRLHPGDVLTVRTGYAGVSAVLPPDLVGAQCFTALVTRPNADVLDSRFLALFLNSPRGERAFTKSQAGGSQKNVNAGALEEVLVPTPSIDEQRRISAALSAWDTAIEKTETLITAKGQRLDHCRDHLLRKPERASSVKLCDVTKELTVRNGASLGREAIMAVTKQSGMRPMREETIAASIARYKRVPPSAFAYNPMRLNIGSIVMSTFDHDVLVSPDYVVFACDDTKLLPSYLHHLRHSQKWKSHFELAGNGSVRVRIYYDDLGRFTFLLPPIDLQARLVQFLDAASEEIALLELQADALRAQKRGLMQKLLTGRWRLPLPELQTA